MEDTQTEGGKVEEDRDDTRAAAADAAAAVEDSRAVAADRKVRHKAAAASSQRLFCFLLLRHWTRTDVVFHLSSFSLSRLLPLPRPSLPACNYLDPAAAVVVVVVVVVVMPAIQTWFPSQADDRRHSWVEVVEAFECREDDEDD